MFKLQQLKQTRESYIEAFKWYSVEQIEEESIMEKLKVINEQIEKEEKKVMEIFNQNTITKNPEIENKNKIKNWLDKLFQNSPSNSLILVNDDSVDGFVVIKQLQVVCKLSEQQSKNCVMEAHEYEKSLILSDDKNKLEKMKNKLKMKNITTQIE